MKRNHLFTSTALACGIVALSLASLQAAPAHPGHGSDVLHFSAWDTMESVQAAPPAWPDVSGRIALQHNEQGNGKVTVQSLDITVQKLAPTTTYAVVAELIGGTPTKVADLATDADGKAKLLFRQVTHKNGKANKLGRGQTELPAALSDLASLRKLRIATEVPGTPGTPAVYTDVLVSDLSAPDKFQYLIKRDLSTDTVRAMLNIVANPKQAQFRLTVAGLTPDADYTLALGDGVAEETTTEVADKKGRVSIKADIDPALDALKLRKVELRTVAVPPATPVVVLSTTLP